MISAQVAPTKYQEAITQQPVPRSTLIENPWEILDASKSWLIDQDLELFEAVSGCETANSYKIYTDNGGLQFHAVEDSDCCCRMCCQPNHGLTLNVHSVDPADTIPGRKGLGLTPQKPKGPILFTLEKPFACNCPALLPFCQKEATMKMANGMTDVAYIQQPCLGGGFTPTLNIYDKQGGTQLGTLQGPCLIGSMCSTTFELFDMSRQHVATFEKKGVSNLKGFAREAFSDADKFTLQWNELKGDEKVDIKLKSAMLGTVLFLDYLFFEGEDGCAYNHKTKTCDLLCCHMFFCGCTVPCKLQIPTQSQNTNESNE